MDRQTKADLIKRIRKYLKEINEWNYFVNDDMEFHINDFSGQYTLDYEYRPIQISFNELDVQYDGKDLKSRTLSEIKDIKKGLKKLRNENKLTN